MLCLSGLELYSRWVLLMSHKLFSLCSFPETYCQRRIEMTCDQTTGDLLHLFIRYACAAPSVLKKIVRD